MALINFNGDTVKYIKLILNYPVLDKLNNTNFFEVSEELTGKNAGKYMSKKLNYSDIINYLSVDIESKDETLIYEYDNTPIGTLFYAAVEDDILLSSFYQNSYFLPADGLVIQYSADSVGYIEENIDKKVYKIVRNDIKSLINILDSMITFDGKIYKVKPEYKDIIVIELSLNLLSEKYDDISYNGKYIYNPNFKLVRLPNLTKVYLKSTNTNAGLYIEPGIPNLKGEFTTGIVTNDFNPSQIDMGIFSSGKTTLENTLLNIEEKNTREVTKQRTVLKVQSANTTYLTQEISYYNVWVVHAGCGHILKHAFYILLGVNEKVPFGFVELSRTPVYKTVNHVKTTYYTVDVLEDYKTVETYYTQKTTISNDKVNSYIMNFNPNNAFEVNATKKSVYNGKDELKLNSIVLKPFIVVTNQKYNLIIKP